VFDKQLDQDIRALIERTMADNPAVPGIVVEVEAPGLRTGLALGRADDAGTALTRQHPVRLASNTKTYVAAGILRLQEEGRIALDDAIARYLPESHRAVLRAGGYDPEAITLRHLLTHTSGLFDYSDSQAFVDKDQSFTYRWTRLEQLEGATAWGRPYGAPGEVFRYSDTGFIELAETLEQVTGLPHYGQALRDLLGFERLGLRHTWLEIFEPAPADLPPRAHQYLGSRSNAGFDASTDLFGGGGLVATLADLLAFNRALFQGRVYRKPETLDLMLTTVMAERGGPVAYGMRQVPGQYRLGLFVLERGGLEAQLHGGYFGTEAAHLPRLDATVALAVNLADSDAGEALMHAVVRRLREERQPASR